MSTLYIMCGPSGSGKSTYAAQLAKNNLQIVIVSTDTIRKEFFGNEEDQTQGDKVFKIAYNRIWRHLFLERDVVFDATNLTRRDRQKLKNFIEYKKKTEKSELEIKYVCIVMNTSLKTCIANQANRARKVPIEVIEKQYKRFQFPYVNDGWNEIRIIEEI